MEPGATTAIQVLALVVSPALLVMRFNALFAAVAMVLIAALVLVGMAGTGGEQRQCGGKSKNFITVHGESLRENYGAISALRQ
jgi:hypothetical protein